MTEQSKKCEFCNEDFNRTYEGKKEWKNKRFCSVVCRNRYLAKKKLKKGYWLDKDGYMIKDIYDDGKRSHVRIHRMVMEKHLGRSLKRSEIVHHKDGDKLNNNIGNLELFSSHREHKLGAHPIPWNKGKRFV